MGHGMFRCSLGCFFAVLCLHAGLQGAGFPDFSYHRIDNIGSRLGQTALVDVDNDGDLDWICGQGGGDIWWWEYEGADQWRRHLVGKGHTDVGGAAFDVNGDGWVDVLSGSRLLLNTGKPGTERFRGHDIGAIFSHDSEFADINGDGRMDVIANCDRTGLFWYEIPEDPEKKWTSHTIDTAANHKIHGGVSPRAVGDLDGDGDADVVTGRAWYENLDGAGLKWRRHKTIDFGDPHKYGLAVKTWVVDLDGDGDRDFVQAEADHPDGRVAWFENDGKARWTRHIIKDRGDRQDFHSLAVADFDGDGDWDVFSGGGPMSARGQHKCYIWENRAGRGQSPAADRWIEHVIARKPCHEAVAADVDGDGDIDICSKPWSTGNEHYFLRNNLALKVKLRAESDHVGKYEKMAFVIQTGRDYDRPFDPQLVDLSLVITTPQKKTLVCPAFFCQDYKKRVISEGRRKSTWMYPAGTGTWRARFAPRVEGRYIAKAKLKDREGTSYSAPLEFVCGPSRSQGFIKTSRKDPRFLEYTEGQPFFPIGQNLAFIGEGQYVTLAKAEDIFARLEKNGANYLRIWTCCKDWALAVEARKSAWGRSWGGKPPFALYPDGDSEKRCIKLDGGQNASVTVSPSHRVALMPGTDYRLSFMMKREGQARVRVSLSGHDLSALSKQGAAEDGNGWETVTTTFKTKRSEFWLGRLAVQKTGEGTIYLDGFSLKEKRGGPELLWEAAINRPVRGYYNPVDCFMLDQVVELAERHGIKLQLCLITRDLYMKDLKDPDSPAYDRAIQDAKNLLRYAVARWGYSTAVAGWEYFNENDPNLPTHRFYRVLGDYLKAVDIYGHLRSTSTWHPSARDCRNPSLDMADVHFYLRPMEKKRFRDEVAAVLDRAAFLRTHAPAKPALLGEFGLASDKWGQTAEMKTSNQLLDFHNAMWASTLSGTSGTALFWWWDRLDRKDHYHHYKPLADFLRDIPWTTARLKPFSSKLADQGMTLLGMKNESHAYYWLFDHDASWGSVVLEKKAPKQRAHVSINITGLEQGKFQLFWWNTKTGAKNDGGIVKADNGTITLEVPAFTGDIAGKVIPLPDAGRPRSVNAIHKQRVPIAMDDGIKLATDIYFPFSKVAGKERMSGAKLTTVLVRLPYNMNGIGGAANPQLKALLDEGWVVILQDTRGKFLSEGVYHPFKDERRDGLATIRWIRAQPWSNGRIGGWGGSYLGYTQWAVADELAVLTPTVTSANMYEMVYPGGIYSLASAFNWGLSNGAKTYNAVKPGNLKKSYFLLPLSDADNRSITQIDFLDAWIAHPEYDHYWSAMNHRRAVETPIFSIAGWYDMFLLPQIRDFQALGPGRHPESRLIIGPYAHGSIGIKTNFGKHGNPGLFNDDMVSFMKRHLAVDKPRVRETKPYTLFIMNRNEWVDCERWPPADSVAHLLTAAGKISTTSSDAEKTFSYTYDPMDPFPSLGGTFLGVGVGPAFQNPNVQRKDQVVFEGPVQKSPLVLLGEIDAVIHASTDVPSTDFFVQLQEVRADGKIINIQEGGTTMTAEPEGSAKPQKLNISLWATGYQIDKGHKLRVVITSALFPRFNRNLNAGEPIFKAQKARAAHQKIFVGKRYPSHVKLPVWHP